MESELSIRDLGEASILLTLGYKLSRLEDSKRGNHKVFVFKSIETTNSDTILSRYRNHEIQVDAYSFFMNIKELKARIHDLNDSN